MPYSLAILDLDGTLADSFPWFLRHVNDVADRFGFRRIEEDEIEPLRRAGSREILKRLEVPLWKLPLIARHMRRLKAAHVGDIPLFPEVEPMLRALHDSGMRLALVSSDGPRSYSRPMKTMAAGCRQQKARIKFDLAILDEARADHLGMRPSACDTCRSQNRDPT